MSGEAIEQPSTVGQRKPHPVRPVARNRIIPAGDDVSQPNAGKRLRGLERNVAWTGENDHERTEDSFMQYAAFLRTSSDNGTSDLDYLLEGGALQDFSDLAAEEKAIDGDEVFAAELTQVPPESEAYSQYEELKSLGTQTEDEKKDALACNASSVEQQLLEDSFSPEEKRELMLAEAPDIMSRKAAETLCSLLISTYTARKGKKLMVRERAMDKTPTVSGLGKEYSSDTLAEVVDYIFSRNFTPGKQKALVRSNYKKSLAGQAVLRFCRDLTSAHYDNSRHAKGAYQRIVRELPSFEVKGRYSRDVVAQAADAIISRKLVPELKRDLVRESYGFRIGSESAIIFCSEIINTHYSNPQEAWNVNKAVIRHLSTKQARKTVFDTAELLDLVTQKRAEEMIRQLPDQMDRDDITQFGRDMIDIHYGSQEFKSRRLIGQQLERTLKRRAGDKDSYSKRQIAGAFTYLINAIKAVEDHSGTLQQERAVVKSRYDDIMEASQAIKFCNKMCTTYHHIPNAGNVRRLVTREIHSRSGEDNFSMTYLLELMRDKRVESVIETVPKRMDRESALQFRAALVDTYHEPRTPRFRRKVKDRIRQDMDRELGKPSSYSRGDVLQAFRKYI